MQEIAGVEALLRELERLEAGERPDFPFYCMLLATGADQDIAEFLRQYWWELDGMTGDACLVFCVAPGCPQCWEPIDPGQTECSNCGTDLRSVPPRIRDVYKLADEFRVKKASMPCAVFFTEPHTSAERLPLVLQKFGAAVFPGPRWTERFDPMMGPFRAISDAVSVAAASEEPRTPHERLARLREALIDEYRAHAPRPRYEEEEQEDSWSTTREQLQDAAGSVEAIKTLGGTGLTVGRVLLKLLV